MAERLVLTYSLFASVVLHGVFFTGADAYDFLRKFAEGKPLATIELFSGASPAAVSTKPEMSVQKAAEEFEGSLGEVSAKPQAKLEVKEKELSEKAVKQAISEELRKFKTEAERKIYLTYYEYLSFAIRKFIIYPGEAKRMGSSGSVFVAFTLDEKGELVDLSIRQGSGSTVLDQAAVGAIRRAAPFSPLPKGLAKAKNNFYVPIYFKKGTQPA